MKEKIVFIGLVVVSLFLFSCGSSSNCATSEKYIPANFTSNIDLDIADASDTSK